MQSGPQIDVDELITLARRGDVWAFTELTRRYRNMAFGYAFTILQDFQLAEDAAQESFIAVWQGLEQLQQPAAFGGWLRSIVRRQCGRIQRKCPLPTVSLDVLADVPGNRGQPEAEFARNEMHRSVMAAIAALPTAEREVTTLYYIQEFSRKEIASFLGATVTMMNNRLYAARNHLKRGLLDMVEETLKQKALPEQFATKIGKIIQVRGTVISAQFTPEEIPDIFGELTITDSGFTVAVEAVRRLDTGSVICIAKAPIQGLEPGMIVEATGRTGDGSVSDEAIERAVQFLRTGRAASEGAGQILETGIKPIDLLCPCAVGGAVAIFGSNGVGTLVLMSELSHRFSNRAGVLSVFKFMDVQDASSIRSFREEDSELREVISRSAVESFYLLSNHATDQNYMTSTSLFDTAIYCSPKIGQRRIWPAIDPLISSSRLLDPAVVGQDHYNVAVQVRDILSRCRELGARRQSGGSLSADEEATLARGLRVGRFLSNPFFVAEPFTKVRPRWVPMQETVQSFREILEGRYDHLPEEAFHFVGGVDELKV